MEALVPVYSTYVHSVLFFATSAICTWCPVLCNICSFLRRSRLLSRTFVRKCRREGKPTRYRQRRRCQTWILERRCKLVWFGHGAEQSKERKGEAGLTGQDDSLRTMPWRCPNERRSQNENSWARRLKPSSLRPTRRSLRRAHYSRYQVPGTRPPMIHSSRPPTTHHTVPARTVVPVAY
jgi:hypothetical protein